MKRSLAARKKAQETALRTARPEKKEGSRQRRRRGGDAAGAAISLQPVERSHAAAGNRVFIRLPLARFSGDPAFCLSYYTCSPQVVVANLINIYTNFEASCILKS